MKKQILLAIAIIAFLNVRAATEVSAQSLKTFRVDIAFDFQVKGETFSAGEYYIESISRSSDGVLALKSVAGGKNRLIVARQTYAGRMQSEKLVFERRGEEYFLTGVFLENGHWGYSVPVPRRKTARNTAAPAKIVEVSLSR